MAGDERPLVERSRGWSVARARSLPRHSSLMEIGRRRLGVVPACHEYLEIWRPAFATYNVLVPNLLNVPAILRRRYQLREIVSLAMRCVKEGRGRP